MGKVAAQITPAGIVVNIALAFGLAEIVPELRWRTRSLPKRCQLSINYGPGKLQLASFVEGCEMIYLCFGIECLLVA